ncbi:MAG: signal peptidase II [Patescibacteria group bacterium]
MKHRLFSLLLILLFAADRLLKEISIKKFSLLPQEDFFIVPKLFNFTFFKNEYLAFSLPAGVNLIIIISIIILAGLFIVLFRMFQTKNTESASIISLIILGALSNLQDRVSLGFVIDYFHLYPISYFNLADLMIGAGIIALIVTKTRRLQD